MVKRTRRDFLKQSAVGAFGLTLVGFGGCQRKENDKTTEGKNAVTSQVRPLSPLTMQAAWVNDAEFMGYFVAIHKKWYENEGLDLIYVPGGPDVIPEARLLGGRADVALTTPDTTVNLILKENAPLKIIGTQYQKSPLGIVSLEANGIRSPKDLIGKTLAVPPVNVISVEALLRLNGIAKEKVKIVPYQYDPTPLLTGEVDATVDFTTNVPYTIREKGAMPASFLMFDFGFTIYNDTVVTQVETLNDRRKELVAWLRASRRGWEENLASPAAYPPDFKDSFFKGNGRTIANEIFFNQQQKALIEAPEGIFSMTEDGIMKNIAALQAIGLKATREMFVTDLLGEL